MRILIVDDEIGYQKTLAILLRGEGYAVETFSDAAAALGCIRETVPDLVITDLRMPGMDGLEFLREVKAIDERIHVVMMTAYATDDTTSEAYKAGVFYQLNKPFEPAKLKAVIAKALASRRLLIEHEELRQRASGGGAYVGRAKATREMLELVAQVAGTRATVLVRGESGTGKEIVARLIHEGSPRRDGPFVKVNCAAIPEHLLESELFGHVKGAFTSAVKDKTGKFHLADGGTIFLDEIGDLPLPLQSKLLRVLQERQFEKVGGTHTITVDARIVAATNRDLEAAIRAGGFREDLFYRLNVFPIRVAPLRERREDVAPLVEHFAARFAAEIGREGLVVDPSFAAALEPLPWPGNARELSNFVERAVILARDGRLDRALATRLLAGDAAAEPSRPASEKLEDVERDHILHVLAECGGSRSQAAERLGIDRTTLYRKLKTYGIKQTDEKE